MIVLAAVLTIASPLAADEGQSVHRCIGAHGEIEFSGLPCRRAAPPLPSVTPTSPARDAPMLACPKSTQALRDVVVAALARHDANAMTGLLRWDGVGAAEARDRLREITALATRPLLDLDVGAEDDTGASTLTVRTGGREHGTHEHAFRIVDDGACYSLGW